MLEDTTPSRGRRDDQEERLPARNIDRNIYTLSHVTGEVSGWLGAGADPGEVRWVQTNPLRDKRCSKNDLMAFIKGKVNTL